jgi:putative flavoprotein involved in K+ transport
MTTIDTVVIGAGHAGLAVSRLLTATGRDHVVLDRGSIAERWRSERWDSLHLLTPNWMTRLPGWRYHGPDQESYMSAGDLVGYLEEYAASFDAPVQEGTTVEDVSQGADGYVVTTDRGAWHARHVVIATGPWGTPHVPAGVGSLDPDVEILSASRYRSPEALAPGAVLVVGASSSGVQIADELARSGRQVTLSVGRHTRMPRRYRGMDVFWWLERTGRLGRTIEEVRDPAEARREPSMQLVGRPEPARREEDLSLALLKERGVELAGRLVEGGGSRIRFAGDLAERASEADRRKHRFLDVVDHHVESTGLSAEVWRPDRPRPWEPAPGPSTLDVHDRGITTVVLATGYRPHHPWLRLPVTTPDGAIRQRRGVTPAPGVYVVGQRFQHRRDSGFIDGARHDAAAVVRHLTAAAQPAVVPSEPSARWS